MSMNFQRSSKQTHVTLTAATHCRVLCKLKLINAATKYILRLVIKR